MVYKSLIAVEVHWDPLIEADSNLRCSLMSSIISNKTLKPTIQLPTFRLERAIDKTVLGKESGKEQLALFCQTVVLI